jgi:dihydroceramide fatty acyl 2-hydroxylase
MTPEAVEAASLRWGEPGFEPRTDRVALFRRRWLDALTRSHPAMPYLLGLPAAAGAIARSVALGVAPPTAALLFAGGWIVWSFVEYAMHRFLFHISVESETAKIAALLAHGHHHVWPRDPRRIAATPIQVGSLVLLLWGMFALVLGRGRAWAALSGALGGYVAYEAVHWICHHGKPRSRLLRALQMHHLRHHANPRSRWGIGSPLWDWVFRTVR